MVCALCAELHVESNIEAIGDSGADDQRFRSLYRTLTLVTSHGRSESMLEPRGVRADGTWQCCRKCCASVWRNEVPRCALINDLWCGAVPDELADLRLVEQTIIARLRLKVNILRFECDEIRIDAAQQRGVKGHAIAFPQVRVFSCLF